ncbi:hypothetical protein U1Q18_047481, partial [Sarracenia purpurea var. burkii]
YSSCAETNPHKVQESNWNSSNFYDGIHCVDYSRPLLWAPPEKYHVFLFFPAPNQRNLIHCLPKLAPNIAPESSPTSELRRSTTGPLHRYGRRASSRLSSLSTTSLTENTRFLLCLLQLLCALFVAFTMILVQVKKKTRAACDHRWSSAPLGFVLPSPQIFNPSPVPCLAQAFTFTFAFAFAFAFAVKQKTNCETLEKSLCNFQNQSPPLVTPVTGTLLRQPLALTGIVDFPPLSSVDFFFSRSTLDTIPPDTTWSPTVWLKKHFFSFLLLRNSSSTKNIFDK